MRGMELQCDEQSCSACLLLQVMLDILENALQQRNIAFLRIDGTVSKASDRQVSSIVHIHHVSMLHLPPLQHH